MTKPVWVPHHAPSIAEDGGLGLARSEHHDKVGAYLAFYLGAPLGNTYKPGWYLATAPRSHIPYPRVDEADSLPFEEAKAYVAALALLDK